MNNAINEIKNTLEGTKSRITETEDRISEVGDKMVEINKIKENKISVGFLPQREKLQEGWPASVCSPLHPQHLTQCMSVLVAQSRPTLCDPMNCSRPGSSLHRILLARILEWVAISLLQGIFLTQGSNPGLPHCRQIFFYHVSHKIGTPIWVWYVNDFNKWKWTGFKAEGKG